MSNVSKVQLKDLAVEMYQGINTVADKVQYYDEGVKILQAKHITKGYIDFSDARNISREDYNKYKEKYQPRINDILMSNIGTIGKSILVEEEQQYVIAWNIFMIRLKESVYARYINYYFQRLEKINYYEKFMTGNATKFINKTTMAEIEFLLPPLKEQQKIAEILSSVDAAIEKTEQVIAKTEEVKKGLMQQLLTKGIGHTEFKESLFGLIPKDWMLVSLSEVADVRDGTHDSPKYQSSGIPFITSKNLRNGKIDFSDCNYITIEDHKKFSVRSFVEKGDILFGMIGTIGSPVIVDIDFDFSIKNVALIKLNKDIVDNRYMKYLLESNLIQKEFSRVSDGGVQKFVALSTIRKLKVPLPNLYEQQKIAKILLNQDSYLDSQFKKLSYLQEIKKGLMQQLLTGQVRVGALC